MYWGFQRFTTRWLIWSHKWDESGTILIPNPQLVMVFITFTIMQMKFNFSTQSLNLDRGNIDGHQNIPHKSLILHFFGISGSLTTDRFLGWVHRI